ncbi:MAG: DUF6178 family protein [Candidatus Poribacteria bacterium]|nr:DUF6178 family protein [Candidatus Poribacteria bacterium]
MQTSKFSLVADAVIDGQSFLARTILHGDTLGRVDSKKSETLSEDIAALAHKLITMKVDDLSNEAELRAQIQTAFALTSLGLEYGSKGNLDKAISVLLANPIVKFFQIGNTLTDKLLKKTSHILEHAIIEPDESLSHLDIDSIRIYNHAEAEFLDALASYNTTISTAQVTIKNNHPPRTFTNLSDMEIIRQQLDYIEARWTYVQALPLEDIFTIDPPLSIAVDPIQMLTLSLMANLTVYFQPDLQLEANTLSDFRDIIYDEGSGEIRESPRQRLLDWIANYLEQGNQPEEVKRYTVAYWDACLQEMVEPDSDLGLLL